MSKPRRRSSPPRDPARGSPPRPARPDPLLGLADLLSVSLDVERILADVTPYVRRVFGADGAAVILATDDHSGFVVAAADGTLRGRVGTRIEPASEGLALRAIATERSALATAPRSGTHHLFEGTEANNAIAAPLGAHGVMAGALVIADRGGADFTDADAQLLDAMASQTAVVLANARLFEMLRRGKRQWEATFDAISEGIAIADEHGEILRANAAFARLVGAALPAVVGLRLGEALFGEPHGIADLLAAANGGHPTPLVRRSEHLGRIVRLAVSPIPSEAGAGSVVVTVDDITEQKALEGQLIQSEKMAAVGTLVSGVAHELNNPLTSIAGLSEFLLEQPPGTVPDRDHLRVIAEQAQRAGSIVRSLLTFARKGPVDREPLMMSDVVERTLFLMGYELRLQNVTVETTIAPDLPAVLGDRHQLQQVVLNLLTNAAQALASLPAGLPRRVSVSVSAEGDRVLVRIADSGLGIPADVLPRLFSPFYTTKPMGEGTGLGLFISYGLVEGHGGTLTAVSRPGEGAVFTVSLPRAPLTRAAAVHAESRRPPSESAGPARRILVVDDDQGVRRMVAALFSREGHLVDAVPDGQAGLRLVRETVYDLVVADRRAAVEGEAFLTVLERERPGWSSRVIVSTSAPRVSRTERGSVPEGQVLRKPFNLRDLRAAASVVWGALEPS